MPKINLILFLFIVLATKTYAQVGQSLEEKIANQPYGKKLGAEFFVDSKQFELTYGLKDDMERAFEYGFINCHLFSSVKKSKNLESGYEIDPNFFSSGVHYLGILNVEDFKNKFDYSTGKNNFVLEAELILLDVVKGDIKLRKSIKVSDNNSESAVYNTHPKFLEFVVQLREAVTNEFSDSSPLVEKLISIVKVDGEKAKMVQISKGNLAIIHKDKEYYVYVEEKTIDNLQIMKYIGKLEQSSEKCPDMKYLCLEVKKGHKEIKLHMDKNDKLFVSSFKIGYEE